MTDPCTPPAETKDGTWHWLVGTSLQRKWQWKGNGWYDGHPEAGSILFPWFLASIGWRYVGPVEEAAPPQYEVCKAVIEPKPDPRDQEIAELRGLLGEVKDRGIRHFRDCATHGYNPCDCGAISVMVKIRVKLGERK